MAVAFGALAGIAEFHPQYAFVAADMPSMPPTTFGLSVRSIGRQLLRTGVDTRARKPPARPSF